MELEAGPYLVLPRQAEAVRDACVLLWEEGLALRRERVGAEVGYWLGEAIWGRGLPVWSRLE